MPVSDSFELLAVTTRSDHQESYHFGALVALDAAGEIELAIGDSELAIYGRSANKPLQAVAMLRAGLDLSPELLALACASHTGTPRHLAVVRQILASAELDERALANTPDYPLDDEAMRDVVRAGGGQTALQMNCSGKHAAMVVTCKCNDCPFLDGAYLEVDHPLQRRITDTVSELAVREVSHVGVDGCGAPAHVLPLVGLAQAFRNLAIAPEPSDEQRVFAAMVAHPDLVGGPGRDVTLFMQGVPGLLAKDGADGIYAAAFADGRAVALKMADGSNRARPAVLAAALQAIGIDVSEAQPAWRIPVLGHGRQVGEVTATF
jgi:L-asparaginase II